MLVDFGEVVAFEFLIYRESESSKVHCLNEI